MEWWIISYLQHRHPHWRLRQAKLAKICTRWQKWQSNSIQLRACFRVQPGNRYKTADFESKYWPRLTAPISRYRRERGQDGSYATAKADGTIVGSSWVCDVDLTVIYSWRERETDQCQVSEVCEIIKSVVSQESLDDQLRSLPALGRVCESQVGAPNEVQGLVSNVNLPIFCYFHEPIACKLHLDRLHSM